MTKRVFVGNLPWSMTSADLQTMFAQYGTVDSAEVVNDRDTGRSRGFGFVEMADQEGMEQSITALNGTECQGRNLTVNEARDKERPSGGRGRFAGRGGPRE